MSSFSRKWEDINFKNYETKSECKHKGMPERPRNVQIIWFQTMTFLINCGQAPGRYSASERVLRGWNWEVGKILSSSDTNFSLLVCNTGHKDRSIGAIGLLLTDLYLWILAELLSVNCVIYVCSRALYLQYHRYCSG